MSSSSERAYQDYCEAWIDGKPPSLDEVLAEHPELEPRLVRFAEVVGALRQTASAASGPGPRGLAAGRQVGQLRLLREIGRGGMGIVFEADQPVLGRRVAVKFLLDHLSLRAESLARFEREATTIARLRHPHIVALHSVGEEEGTVYFVMELVRGVSLDRIIRALADRDRPPRSGRDVAATIEAELGDLAPAEMRESCWSSGYIETVCRTAVQIADALEHAHRASIVHRDVKPSNILLRPDGAAVLTDFGLARTQEGPTLTRTGDFAGTPHYMAPEQIDWRHRRELDGRADVFALGVTLFELLTLRRPFEGESSEQVLARIVHDEPDWRAEELSRLPRDLVLICSKALEKEPQARYESAAALADDLRRFLSFEPVLATAVGRWGRTVRWARRHPSRALAVVLLAAIVIGGPSLFALQQRAANRRIQSALEGKQAALVAMETALDEKNAALDAVVAARQRAEEESRVARETVSLLADMFRMPSPTEGLGHRLTASDMLRLGAGMVEERLKDRPEIRARLLGVLGSVCSSLGLYEDAERLLVASLEGHPSGLEGASPDVLQSARELASMRVEQSRAAESTDLLAQALERARAVHGPRHPATLALRSEMARNLAHRQLYEQAEEAYRTVLADLEETLGPDHMEALTCEQNLGCLMLDVGRFREAEDIFRRTLPRIRAALGEDHPSVPRCQLNLGVTLEQLDRFEEAKAQYESALAGLRRRLPPGHPTVFGTLISLALIHERLGEPDEAERLYLETLRGAREHLGDDAPLTLAAMMNLAALYIQQVRFAEADPLVVEAYAGRRRVLGEDHPDTLTAKLAWGRALIWRDQEEEGERVLREVITDRRRVLGDDHPRTVHSMTILASFLQYQGRLEKAAKLFEEALEVQERALGSTHSRTLDTTTRLATLYRDQRRLEEAEHLARRCLESTAPSSPERAKREQLLRSIQGD